MLLKGMGLLLLGGFFAGLGYYGASRLGHRARQLRKMEQLLESLGVCLSARLEPPCTALEGLLKQPAYESFTFLQSCVDRCKAGIDFPSAWEEAFREKVAGFRREELDWLESLGHVLGQSALPLQTAVLEQVRMQIKSAAAAAEERAASQGKVYRTVGLLGGALVTIVLL